MQSVNEMQPERDMMRADVDEETKKRATPVPLDSSHGNFELETFEEETMNIEIKFGNAVLEMEVRTNVISAQDLSEILKGYSQARYNAKRVIELQDQQVKLKEDSDEFAELQTQLDLLESEPTDIDISIEQMILPSLVRWNATRGGVPVDPTSARQIKEFLPAKLLGDISKKIQAVVSGELRGNGPKARTRRNSRRR